MLQNVMQYSKEVTYLLIEQILVSAIELKVFPEGLMVEVASKNISRCTVSYTALPMKTDLHFQPTLP